MKYFLAVLLLATELQAAPLSIIPNGQATLVTAGIPFAPCVLPDVATFKLVNESGAEVPIFIKPTLFWPATKCAGASTVRAVKIQFAYDPGQRENEYDWQLEPRTLPDLQEAPIAEIVSENPARDGFKEPAFFAINDPAYLVTTGLISPTTVAGKSEYDRKWYPTSIEGRIRTTDFRTTAGEAWLFDAASAIYQQAIRTGAVAQYREAYLEHEFYVSKMEVINTATLGSFSLAEGDIKYIYLTPIKLHLALTGDDSWTPGENASTPNESVKDRTSFLKYIATKAFDIRGIGVAYTDVGARFTEREAGFALQQMVAAYELTGDTAILANLKTAVNNLYSMIGANPDGIGNNGYLSHSWDAHEGDYPAYIGMTPEFSGSAEATQTMSEMVIHNPIGNDYLKMVAGSSVFFKPYGPMAELAQAAVKNADGTLTITLQAPAAIRSNQWALFLANGQSNTRVLNFAADRAFSPWMQAILADGLWQLYNIADDVTLKSKISDMLLGFGRAITAYAIDGNGLKRKTKELIETGFNVEVVSSGASGSRGIVPYTRYVANYLMSGAPQSYIDYMAYDGAFSDQHSPEALFQISLAIRFETDPAKKAAMQAVATDLTEWFADPGKTIGEGHPARYFNWTNKSDAWGTYEAVMQIDE